MPELRTANVRHIVITGHLGFIGAKLALALQKAGHMVSGIDRAPSANPKSVVADLLDADDTKKAWAQLSDCDVLVHLAALAHGQKPPVGESCLSVNTKITRNIFAAVPKPGPHVILFSSVAVYGEDQRNYPVLPNDETRPSTEYGQSKLDCEQMLLSAGYETVDILRLAPVFDSEHLRDLSKRIKPIRFMPGLRFFPPPEYSLCHVDTVIKAVLNLVERRPRGGRCRNVADAKPYTQSELAKWYPCFSIPLPLLIIRPLYWFIRLVPGKRGYSLRCLYAKLFNSNVYSNEEMSVSSFKH